MSECAKEKHSNAGFTLVELLVALVLIGVFTGAAVLLVAQLGDFRIQAARLSNQHAWATLQARVSATGLDASSAGVDLGQAAAGDVIPVSSNASPSAVSSASAFGANSRVVGAYTIMPRVLTIANLSERVSAATGGFLIQPGAGGTVYNPSQLVVQADVMLVADASDSDGGVTQNVNAATQLDWTTSDPKLRFRARVTTLGAVQGRDYVVRWTLDDSTPLGNSTALTNNSWAIGDASPNVDCFDHVSMGTGVTFSFTLKLRAFAVSGDFTDSAVISVPVTVTKIAPTVTQVRSGSDTGAVSLADVYAPAVSGANYLRVQMVGLPESIRTPGSSTFSLTNAVGNVSVAQNTLTVSTTPSSPAAGAIVTATYDFLAPATGFTAGAQSTWSSEVASAHGLVYFGTTTFGRSLTPDSNTPPTVSISPTTGSFGAAQNVTITSSAPTPDPLVGSVANSEFYTLRYTTNGGAVSSGATEYAGSFSVNATTTIRAANIPVTTYAAFFSTPAEDSETLTISTISGITGTVFEDKNYAGGAGRILSSALSDGGSARASVTVELYTVSGTTATYSTSTTTNSTGGYTFSSLDPGSYVVRVVSTSVTSSRTGYNTTVLPVQTYRTNGSSGAAIDATDFVGGQNPAVSDAGAGSSGATFNTSTGVFSAVVSGTAHSFAPVTISGGGVSGVNFGYSFSVVTNTNDSGQGSLRQFMTNANLLSNSGLAINGRTSGIEHAVFMISNGTAAAGLRSTNNYFSSGVATVSPTSALPTITEAIVIDAQTQTGWSTSPVIELNGTSAGTVTAAINATNTLTLRGLIINRFTGHGVSITGGNSSVIQGNWAGLNNTGTAKSANTGDGVTISNSAGVQIGGNTTSQRNVLSGNNQAGLRIQSSSTGAVVKGNYIGLNAVGSAALGNGGYGIGVLTSSTSPQIGGTAAGEGNFIAGNTNVGLFLSQATGAIVQGNVFGRNASNSATLTSTHIAIHLFSSTSVQIGGTAAGAANVITGANSGNNTQRAGVLIVSNSQAQIFRNSIYGNGNLGLDISANTGGADGVTVNDGAKTAIGNLGMDSPVFTSASVSSGTLTVAGYVGSAAGQATFASATVEIFVSDNDSNGYGEGQTYIGTLTADASGNFSGGVSIPGGVTVTSGTKITATATDGSGNTSEFGANYTVP